MEQKYLQITFLLEEQYLQITFIMEEQYLQITFFPEVQYLQITFLVEVQYLQIVTSIRKTHEIQNGLYFIMKKTHIYQARYLLLRQVAYVLESWG